jgi:hypothetical protein
MVKLSESVAILSGTTIGYPGPNIRQDKLLRYPAWFWRILCILTGSGSGSESDLTLALATSPSLENIGTGSSKGSSYEL